MSNKINLKSFGSILLLLACFSLFSGVLTASAAPIFADVTTSHWAQKEIEFLNSKSIIDGYKDGNKHIFKPENKVTRAQAAKMIMVALDQTEKKNTTPSFKDVPSSHWAIGWIERAKDLGVLSGNEKGLFNPEQPLSRAQMSKMLTEAFGLDTTAAADKDIVFKDINKDFWAASYINALYYSGISNGSGNKFKPNEHVTRAHFSVFIGRTLNEDFRLTPQEPATNYGKVTASSLNVRASASASSTVVGKLKLGDNVQVTAINGYWANIKFGSVTGYVHKNYLKLKNADANPLKNRIIVIDAGHGGKDPGTHSGSHYEKDITINVAKKVQSKLQNQGARVIMTRTGDTYPTLSDRVATSKNQFAELFVSIHVNSAGPTAKGAETYYNSSKNENSAESIVLAKDIQNQIISLAGMYNRGVKDQEFYVIKNQNIPSVLVELGFITNSEDLLKLTSSKYQELYAEAIYRGVKNYYSK